MRDAHARAERHLTRSTGAARRASCRRPAARGRRRRGRGTRARRPRPAPAGSGSSSTSSGRISTSTSRARRWRLRGESAERVTTTPPSTRPVQEVAGADELGAQRSAAGEVELLGGRPSCTIRPSRMSAIRSASENASSRSWVTSRTVTSAARGSRRARRASRCAGAGRCSPRARRAGRPPGGRERAREGDALLLAAGELVRVALAEPPEPTTVEQLRDARRGGAGRRSRRSRRRSGVGRARSPGRPSRPGGARAGPRRRRPRPGRPSISIAPASGRSKPAIRRSSVVLPQPDGRGGDDLAALDAEPRVGRRRRRSRSACRRRDGRSSCTPCKGTPYSRGCPRPGRPVGAPAPTLASAGAARVRLPARLDARARAAVHLRGSRRGEGKGAVVAVQVRPGGRARGGGRTWGWSPPGGVRVGGRRAASWTSYRRRSSTSRCGSRTTTARRRPRARARRPKLRTPSRRAETGAPELPCGGAAGELTPTRSRGRADGRGARRALWASTSCSQARRGAARPRSTCGHARRRSRGRGAIVLVPEIALTPQTSGASAALRRPGRRPPLGASARGAARRARPDRRAARRRSSSARGRPSSRRCAGRADRRRRGARRVLQAGVRPALRRADGRGQACGARGR